MGKVLLFVLWYCHKRGREVRLEREGTVEAGSRIEELPDDPALPPPVMDSAEPVQLQGPIIVEPEAETSASGVKLPPPPIGADRRDD